MTFGDITRLLVNIPPGFTKSLMTDVFWPAWEWGPMGMPHLRYVTFSYSASLTERDNERFSKLLTSQEYVELWGDKFQVTKTGVARIANNKTGWKLASSVGGVGTGERGDRVLLDDPHNVKEVESETVRSETVRWFRESMSNRLNNEASAIVIIMQRLHEADVSGTILSEGFDYCHLMIPMEYDPDRYPVNYEGTDIGWNDPRTEDGELAWPERFPENSVETFKRELGPFAWCTPAESPVLMADLSLKPIGQISAGDEIVGFTIDTTPSEASRAFKWRRLTKTRVLSISRSIQPVVRMVLDSGEVVRCTADHKWYAGKDGRGRLLYWSAKVGRKLMRICPPRIPQLTSEDEIRDAAWLAGFFDGEGTAAYHNRRRSESSVCISFAQGTGRNKPLCDNLERVLTRFGFDYNYKEGIRTDRKNNLDTATPQRWYWLRGNSLPMYQKLLHVIRPLKWRDRIEHGGYGARFIIGQEHVLSIEPDGTEEVFGLETTTGNYVVWGLASSNSGQYQQSPTPRGGGIFKREWWQVWEPRSGTWPAFDYVVASLDSAYTKDTMNDPSALTVWGLFHTDGGLPAALLVKGWQKHLEMHGTAVERLKDEPTRAYLRRSQPDWGLVEWVAETCRFRNPEGVVIGTVDKLLIEAKASGLTAAQEMQRLYGNEGWVTELSDPRGDKVARAHSVVPIFANGQVFAPMRDWADVVIDECATFPHGRHDDLVDTVTQALRHMRGLGLLQMRSEIVVEEEARARLKGRKVPLYSV